MRVLINCTGFIGDVLFASSVAKKLKEENKASVVDYLIHLYQPYELLTNNPYIDNVYLFDADNQEYDKTINLHEIDFAYPPAQYYQLVAGVENHTPDFQVYTNKSYDYLVSKNLNLYRTGSGKLLVAYMSGWKEKAFSFNKDQYEKGVNIPYLGYGGKLRDTDYILSELSKDDCITLVSVGMPPGYNVREADFTNTAEYSMQASFLKHCDYFIGAEGGLCNLAAGVGTSTIITGDFVHQLYGWNGVIKKIKEPKLGPKYYFNNDKHVTLDPYLTDKQVVLEIKNIIK